MTKDRDTKALMADALLKLKEARQRIQALEEEKHGEIAVVGLGLRFPGPNGDIDNADGFWRFLSEGGDATGDIPADRWDVEQFHDEDYDAPGRIVSKRGAFLRDPSLFDPQFFGISPREAETMDPQQRLLLEASWRALEHAGIGTDNLRGSRTGVFIGIATADYSIEMVRRFSYDDVVALTGTGTNHSVAAGRISYTLGLTGPCVAINTACSSSLVALHLACESLRRGECDAALVGGVNLMLSPMTSMVFSNARMLSRDGRCKTFDESADGYGRGEGVGVVVLKRRRDAERDRDRILACVLGAAINQDGASGGITVPNGPSQESVIRAALTNARLAPEGVGYVEAHGTGTALGDPIEMGALGAVFGDGRGQGQPLAVGSIKTNLGHTEAAAGVAGLIKVVLQLVHREFAPHLHLDAPSKHIPWEQLPVHVPTAREAWDCKDRRIAGLSSFGFSGTNVHIVLGEHQPAEARDATEDPPGMVLPISARGPDALRGLAESWRKQLEGIGDEARVADACFTAGRGRSHFPHRLAITGATKKDLVAGLARWLASGAGPGVFQGEVHERLTAKTLTLPANASEVAIAYVEGLRVPWDALDPEGLRCRITIPGYPFRRERFWCLPETNEDRRFRRSTDTFVFTSYTWTSKAVPRESPDSGTWAISGEGALADRIVADLVSKGVDSVRDRDPLESDTVAFVWDAEDGPDGAERGCAKLLSLVQDLAAAAKPPRLAVVTRDGVSDAAVQGLARVAGIEHPELRVRRVVVAGGGGGAAASELLTDDGEDEVRLVATERQVGRLLETKPTAATTAKLTGTWLITGGLGAIGRKIARRLVERGVERIVLVGRSETAELPADLKGLPVELHACDVADASACDELVASLPHLRGVVHGAGVLDDGILIELTEDRLNAVLRPKLRGGWNLHEATSTREGLEHFVMLSSSAAVLGSPGQANYVAANWSLEALARARRRAGLPAITIHYGPWAEEGMAASEETAFRLEALGLRTLAAERCLDAFETLLDAGHTTVGFFFIDWRRFARAVPPSVQPRRLEPFLASLPTQAAEGEPEFLGELMEAETEDRDVMIEDYVARALGRVLRMPPQAVDRQRPFAELGLDSLMGVELRNRIQADLHVTAAMTDVLATASTATFAGTLQELLLEAGLLADLEMGLADDDAILDEIESMTDEEVQRFLDSGG